MCGGPLFRWWCLVMEITIEKKYSTVSLLVGVTMLFQRASRIDREAMNHFQGLRTYRHCAPPTRLAVELRIAANCRYQTPDHC